jgi:hypothetical protein
MWPLIVLTPVPISPIHHASRCRRFSKCLKVSSVSTVSQPAEAGGMQIGCGALQVHAPSTRHSGCFEAWKLAEVQERPRRRSTHAKARRLYNGRDKLPKSHIDALASRAMCRKLTHCYPVRKVEFAFRGLSWHVPGACCRPFTRVLTCSNAPLNPKHP